MISRWVAVAALFLTAASAQAQTQVQTQAQVQAQARAAAPATQPASGPGGTQYSHAGVRANYYGEGARAYWIFEPDKPAPAKAPLIVFNHGWSAMQPATYADWIDHIVRRGNIVVYPVYQASLRTPPANFTPNAVAALRDALARLGREQGRVKPDLERVAVVGHSMGGILSANMAALAEREGLPRFRAVMCVEPGLTRTASPRARIALADLNAIPRDTLLLAVAGDRDKLVGDFDAKRIFYESRQVPPENKNYVVLVSDDHGRPALVADHFAPMALARRYIEPAYARLGRRMATSAPVGAGADAGAAGVGDNALDFYGTWKLLDGLTDAAFYGTNRRYALGDTPEQRFMGLWSDGTPVKELRVLAKP